MQRSKEARKVVIFGGSAELSEPLTKFFKNNGCSVICVNTGASTKTTSFADKSFMLIDETSKAEIFHECHKADDILILSWARANNSKKDIAINRRLASHLLSFFPKTKARAVFFSTYIAKYGGPLTFYAKAKNDLERFYRDAGILILNPGMVVHPNSSQLAFFSKLANLPVKVRFTGNASLAITEIDQLCYLLREQLPPSKLKSDVILVNEYLDTLRKTPQSKAPIAIWVPVSLIKGIHTCCSIFGYVPQKLDALCNLFCLSEEV